MAATHSRVRRRTAIALAAILTLVGASAAFAYWTSTGNGAGSATTGASVSFVVTTETAEGTIAPGGPGQTIAFTITNPGPGTQFFGSVNVRLADSTGAPWEPPPGCLIEDYTAIISMAPVPGQLAAEESVAGIATVSLANTAVSQDECQRAIVPLYFEALNELP